MANLDILEKWKVSWSYPTSLLCLYGFFSTVKPLEPFLIPYLTGHDKNLTMEQVTNRIFPVWTYSYLAVLVPVFLLTDWLRYKPVVVFQCTTLFVTTAMLLWSQGVGEMQAMQFVYGVVTACEVAYFSYIYSVVDLQHYLKATSYCRTAQLLGYTVGSVLGQILVSFSLLSYYYILVLTLVLISVALVTSVFLPMPKTSMFFHHKDQHGGKRSNLNGQGSIGRGKPIEIPKVETDNIETAGGCDIASVQDFPELKGKDSQAIQEISLKSSGAESSPAAAEGCCVIALQLWQDFLQCYSTQKMLYWSAWWAMATCGYNQTVNYIQALWEHAEPSSNFTVYNGGVEAVSSLFGAAAAYGIGFSPIDWARWGEMALASLSGLGGGALYVMVFTANIWICYAGYIIFKSLYMLLITIAMFQIAAGLSTECYALVFGTNTFIALILQTILTSVVVDSRGFGLDIVYQFIIYGTYFFCIALVFFLRGLYSTLYLQSAEKGGAADDAPQSTTITKPDTDTCGKGK
ncbi:thiamine transporter 2 isoform X1 [Electrophorus electricus]|uniref:thiamine transporter 2 isoform X1 n=1 Tax=Electrophorus electricus TaxID=8005 RepID=UPI0015D0B813|nr:thiamine transporter 2 isoform X1 [Electrophorus electricus]XP_026878734.2 thiamine transporter 2 isoform X1 [Electrophorus electricus]